ncbi:PQQ-binding-like beta-propeller repeat protein [Streptomyces sp. NPDC015220]|uniref:outer membrane protein assembly factor BamB family protein n=1 Tax=Streptomyces sp. NPDC015220 TaxID=3364947 RepID=UPI003701EE64
MQEDKAPDAVWGSGRRWWALSPVWKARREIGRDDGPLEEPIGGWLTDELVIRADFDRLRAYDPATGAVRWTWQVPGRDVLVAASRTTTDGTALVAHHDDGSYGSPVTVAAVDLGTGERLWSTTHRDRHDSGLAPRDFTDRCPAALLSGRRIASVSDERLRSVDPKTGVDHWSRPLPAGAEDLDLWVASADPFVVVGKGRGRRGEWRVFVLDDRGEETASFVLSVPYDKIRTPATVVDGMLVAQLAHPKDSGDATSSDYDGLRIGGFDLSTGELRWEWRPGRIDSVLPHRGRLLLLHSYGHRIAVLDARDGRVIARRKLRGSHLSAVLAMAGDRFAVLGRGGDTTPLRVFHWR